MPCCSVRSESLVRTSTVEAYPDEPLRVVVYRMAEKGFDEDAGGRALHREIFGAHFAG